MHPLPKLPQSWSSLTWQQLLDLWQVKIRYGHLPGVARAAALLALLRLQPQSSPRPRRESRHESQQQPSPRPRRANPLRAPRLLFKLLRYHRSTTEKTFSPLTGEPLYLLRSKTALYTVTPRELSQIAAKTLRWFDYPYGDPGEEEQKDDHGKITKERREPVHGYVNPVSDWHDALALPMEKVKIKGKTFALPQVACYNLTWEQYRSLQAVATQLFREGITEEESLDLHAQFLAHCLTPRSFAILDTTGSSVRLRPHHEYTYNAARAEALIPFWRKAVAKGHDTLFHVCFQAYHTAVGYYAVAYPLLFGSKKSDTMTDALKGESRTVNAVMKYAGYAEQQQVYDSNLPFVLDILNTMSEEARQIEEMNAKIKSKK